MFRKYFTISGFLIFSMSLFAQEQDFVPIYIKSLRVDSCIIFKMEQEDSIQVKHVIDKVIFNADGQISEYTTMPKYEEDDTIRQVYEYVNGKLVLVNTYGADIVPIETKYIYKNGQLIQELVSGAEPRDYDIFVDNEGRMLEKNGKTAFPEIDSITGEATGKMIWQPIDAYEYKYNKYKKVTEEVFIFYGQESSRTLYDYGPSGNMPLQKKTIYRYGDKQPDTEITYTYTPDNLIASQQYYEFEDGSTDLLTYEYFYAAAPAGSKNPASPNGFTLPPPPKLPKGKGSGKVKDYKNPSW